MATIGDSATMHTPYASYPMVVTAVSGTGKTVYAQHGDLSATEPGKVIKRANYGHAPYKFILRNGMYTRTGGGYHHLSIGEGIYIPNMN